MKLNLLPQKVSQGQHLKLAYVVGAAIFLVTCLGCVAWIGNEQNSLNNATTEVKAQEDPYAAAYATSNYMDTVVADGADVIRDANLAQDMIAHNDAYPKLYDDLRPYIPAFFRITSEAAAPQDETTSTITLTGTLMTYQQYADVVLALMRFPDAISISRSGFNLDDPIVPGLTETDNKGMVRRPDQAPIPQNQLEQLTALESQPQPQGYLGIGNFGLPGIDTKGAAPKESMITIVMTVKRDLQTPEPTTTLSSGGGGASTTLTAGFGPQGGPTGPGGPPGPGGGPGRFAGGPPGMGGRSLGGPPGGFGGAPGAGGGSPRPPSKSSDGD